jgi:hypothetical protein
VDGSLAPSEGDRAVKRFETNTSESGGVMDANADAPSRGVWRVFALLSVPFVLFTIGVVYLVEFSDLGLSLRDVAADEQATAVRYAIERTPPAEVPHLLAAAARAPSEWDRRANEAVVSLLERSLWPPPHEAAGKDVDNAALLATPPADWSPEQAASVLELLQRFRSFHTARRPAVPAAPR